MSPLQGHELFYKVCWHRGKPPCFVISPFQGHRINYAICSGNMLRFMGHRINHAICSSVDAVAIILLYFMLERKALAEPNLR